MSPQHLLNRWLEGYNIDKISILYWQQEIKIKISPLLLLLYDKMDN